MFACVLSTLVEINVKQVQKAMRKQSETIKVIFFVMLISTNCKQFELSKYMLSRQ